VFFDIFIFMYIIYKIIAKSISLKKKKKSVLSS